MAKDILARGGIKATFQTTGGGNAVSQNKWDAAFADFDPEAYRQKEVKPVEEDLSSPTEKYAY